MKKILFLLACIVLVFDVCLWSEPFDFYYRAYGRVLTNYVANGLVDYGGLKAQPEDLIQFLDQAAQVTEEDFASWDLQDQLAFLINLYNASTLQLVIKNYPIKNINDIGSFLQSPRQMGIVNLFGTKKSLDYIQFTLIFKKSANPQTYFALVPAAVSSPILSNEPYKGFKLYRQLEEQTRLFLNDELFNRINVTEKKMYLSSIFDWYKADFLKKVPSLLDYVLPYFSKEEQQILRKEKFEIEYLPYNWALNDQALFGAYQA